MDFFESQDAARRNTKMLLLLFGLAVLSLIVLTNGLVFLLGNFQDTASIAGHGAYYYSWEMFATVSAGVILLVALASLFRMHSLRKGGSAIAELMDGELLVDHGGDLNKRKLLNVVQEMAIASGTPVPPVYLIHDPAINAFAAGYSPGDAVIGITTGAIEHLNRDELQGVIAHEFSHILNGDMRLNIRLIGILYGILMLALVGRMILQPSHAGAASRSRSGAAVMAVGLGLMAVGYLGQFFGNLIKAAVSRQREFLADASAVQFTRNPTGIAGALKRIGGYSNGSVLSHPESAEISHSFFSEGVSFAFKSMMATHPPLPERIKRIDPGWDGKFLEADTPDAAGFASAPEGAMGFAAGDASIDAEKALESIGNPDTNQVAMAREMISAIPDHLMKAAQEPYSARALVYLLALDSKAEVRSVQLSHLEKAADLGVYESLTKLLEHSDQLQPSMRLPLVEIAFATLRQLSYEQYKLFQSNLDTIIRADGRVGLSEWALQKMLSKHLGEVFEMRHSSVKFQKLEEVSDDCQVLLSMLAYCDRKSNIEPAAAFAAGQEELAVPIQLMKTSDLSFNRLNDALDNLAALHPLRKPKLLKACIRTVSADDRVSMIERELLRTIADTLECPMPPFGSPGN